MRTSLRYCLVVGTLVAAVVGCRNPLLVDIRSTIEEVVSPPAVTAVFPSADATDIPTNTSVISVSFTKTIDPRTVTTTSFVVAPFDGSSPGTPVAGTRTVQNETVTFTPSTSLSFDTLYRITATTAIRDTDGNPLPSQYSWTFRTGLAPDLTPPHNPSVVINDGDEWTTRHAVILTLSVTDDRGVAQMNISFTGVFADNWTTYQETHPVNLPAGDGVRSVWVRFRDAAGNQSSTASASIRVDTSPPVVSVFAVDGGRSATRLRTVTLGVFAEDATGDEAADVTEYQWRPEGSDWPDEWSTLDRPEGEGGSDLTNTGSAIVPDVGLPADISNGETATYEARVRDQAGNVSAVVSAAVAYDLTPPDLDIARISPAQNQTGVPFDTSAVHVYFNEEIDTATFTPVTFSVEDGTSALEGGAYVFGDSGAIRFGRVSLTGLTLAPNTDYFVTIAGTVTDVAGNPMGSDRSWYFRTGTATDSTAPNGRIAVTGFAGSPPAGSSFEVLPDGRNAVNHHELVLTVDAWDDYNTVYGINIWGEGDLSRFEEPVSGWKLFEPEQHWTLGVVEGVYNLWYRLQDSRGNKTPDPPLYFAVVLDTTPPTVANVTVRNGALDRYGSFHVGSGDGRLDLFVTASDAGPGGVEGSGIARMRLSNDGEFPDPDPEEGPEVWRAWTPLYEGWETGTVEGLRTLYLQVEDYVRNAAPTYELEYFYDTSAPVIEFGGILNTNAKTRQSVSVTDNVIGGLVGTVDDDLVFLWEQAAGEGTVSFEPASAREPLVSADEDGSYLLRLTVSDPAGNTASATVPFTWDTTPPADMGPISVSSGAYSTTGYPEFTWSPVSGADQYTIVISDAGEVAVVETTTTQTGFTPAVGLPEGLMRITVVPYDLAGNAGGSSQVAVTVDTIAPEISDDGQVFLTNAAIGIDYTGDDGTVTDGGSGIDPDSIAWSLTAGPGAVAFGSPTSLTTSVSATADGSYSLALTVSDRAGNTSTANFTLTWDTFPPNAPVVSGIERTPNLRPTWSWVSGGNGGGGIYQYRLHGRNPVVWGGETTATTFTPTGPLDQGTDQSTYTHTLDVQERDAAGNWSPVTSRGIWVDSSFTAPPEVTVGGNSYTSNPAITWNWSTGGGNGTFRWRIDGGAWLPSQSGSTDDGYLYNSPTNAGQDKTYAIQVEEQTTTGVWAAEPKYGTSSVRVDRMGPVAPTVAGITATPTTNTRPTWTWSSNAGSDGTGNFRYRLNAGSWTGATTATTFSPATSLANGPNTLEVQEFDTLGNPGMSGSHVITVDTTPPTLNSVTINSGAVYTRFEAVTLAISAVTESGMEMSIYDFNPAGWKPWEAFSATKSVTMPSGEGTKYVYVRLRDALGNTSAYKYDSIILDQTPPTNGSVVINSGDTYTPSLNAVLSVGASDSFASQAELEVQYYYNSVYSSWIPFQASFQAQTNFTAVAGTKTVNVRFRDPAGNLSGWYSDSIYLQIPSPTHALKGQYSNGSTVVSYNGVTEPSGPATTAYYVYYSTNANANPNTGGAVTHAGATTNTSAVTASVPRGQLLYFWVRAHNADSGGWGPYSLSSVLGFSSHVTVVYNSGNSADAARAADIKSGLEAIPSMLSLDYVIGKLGAYSVTLLPESLVSNTYSTNQLIYGRPIILSSGTSFTTGTTYDGRVRNIASTLSPVVAMGFPGGYFLTRLVSNFGAWGISGTSPSAITSGQQMTLSATATAVTRTASSSEGIWYNPIYHSEFYPYRFDSYTTEIFAASVGRRGVYISSGQNPPDGVIYAGDPNASNHFPVVRQGRYLYYGFVEPSDTLNPSGSRTPPRMGAVFFVNLIARMAQF